MGEERIADTQVTRPRSTEQTAQEDRSQNRGSRADVECNADECHHTQPASEREAVGITQLLHRLSYGGNGDELHDGVDDQEQSRQCAERAACPQRSRRSRRNGNVWLHETLLLTM